MDGQYNDEDLPDYEPVSGDQLGREHSQKPPVVNSEGRDSDKDVLPRYAQQYDIKAAADILGTRETLFDTMRADQEASDQCRYHPFADREEWGLAEWLIRNVNQQETDEFLRLPIVSQTFKFS